MVYFKDYKIAKPLDEVETQTPKVGEFWVLGGLPPTRVGVQETRLYNYARRWDELNDKEVKIINDKSGLLDFSLVENPEVSACVSPNYLVRRLDRPTNCCRPSIALCDGCKAEFTRNMQGQNKVYNPYYRLWEKKR